MQNATWRRVWIELRKRKNSAGYNVRWIDDRGRIRSESAGSNRRHAEDLRREKEQALNSGLLRNYEPVTLEEFMEEHLELMQARRQPATIKDQRQALSQLTEYVGGSTALHNIRPRMTERFIAHRRKTVSAATANKELRTLRGIFNHAIRREYLPKDQNPFDEVEPEREPEKEIRVLALDEVEKLLGACLNLRWKTLCFLALTTGMRLGELQNLRWEDIDLELGIVTVRNKATWRTKSGKIRRIPMVRSMRNLLERYGKDCQEGLVFRTPAGDPIRNNVQRDFQKIVKSAGITRCTMHDLRRTFVSTLANSGQSEATAQRLAGHANITTTLKHYTHIMDETLVAATASLSYANAPAITTLLPLRCYEGKKKKTA